MTAIENQSSPAEAPRSAKPVLVLHATRHGHTRRIAEHLAEQLADHQIEAQVVDATALPAGFELTRYRAALLVASVHIGKHPRELVDFVTRRREALEGMFSALLSVSLSEAGAEDTAASAGQRAAAARDVRRMIDQFYVDTSFHPNRTLAVAGALAYTKYNPLVRLVMKRIARAAGASTDTTSDHDLTDWRALDRFASELARELGAALAPASPRPAGQPVAWFEVALPPQGIPEPERRTA